MIEPLQQWKTSLAALPKVIDGSWAQNFAMWYASRIINIQPDPTVFVASGFLFLFPVPIFAAKLIQLTPVNDPLSGISGFANAWEATINSVLYPVSLTMSPGSFKVPASPATTFSAIASVVIDPASILAGKKKIMELVTAPKVKNAMDSQFPQKFREATLLLKINVDGTNSVTPSPGPLSVPGVPLV